MTEEKNDFAKSTTIKLNPELANMLEREEDELPKYFKSFGFTCHYDWDREYSWYEVYKNHRMVLQIESGTSVERFIQLMVEYFTDAWETPPIFLASEEGNEKLFELCKTFPEFNEKIKDLNIIL